MKYLIILKEKLVPAFFAGVSIFIISFFLKITIGNAILFASLGASSVILAEFPDRRIAKLRVVLFSYLIAAITGYLFYYLKNVPLAAGLAIFTSISLMAITNNIHPPAGGLTLAFIFQPRFLNELVTVFVSIVFLLVLLKSIIYLYKKELNIKKFHHEFLK